MTIIENSKFAVVQGSDTYQRLMVILYYMLLVSTTGVEPVLVPK